MVSFVWTTRSARQHDSASSRHKSGHECTNIYQNDANENGCETESAFDKLFRVVGALDELDFRTTFQCNEPVWP